MLKYFLQYKFSILLAGFIALVSLIPSSSMPESRLFAISYLDKVVHFGMYGLFSFVAFLESRCRQNCRLYHLVLALTVLLLSAGIEVLQATVVATRSAEWFDLLANAFGLIGGYVAFRVLKWIIS